MINKTILIVEDDPYLSRALSVALVETGYAIVLASRFSDAIYKTNNQRFSCILMDLQIEMGSGLKVIQQIRDPSKQGINFETPIILMSGHLEADIIKAAAGKVQAVIAKPFNTASVLEKISDLTT